MKTSPIGLSLIKESEGLRLKPYLCPAGVPTIGYGNTFYEDGTKVTMKDKAITPERAHTLLLLIAAKFEKEVNAMVKVELTQGQFDALVDFAFNLGSGNLKSSTLLKKLNAGDYAGAANEFSKWVNSGGKPLPGLVTRRAKEKALFQG